VMCIRTESYPGKNGYNEIRIDDSSSAQKIYIRAEQEQLIVVEHDKREWIGHDERYTIEDDTSRRVDKHQTLHVGDDHVVRVGGSEERTVEKNRVEKIGGNENVHAGGAVALDVGRDERESVGALRMTIAGGITLPGPPNPLESAKPALGSTLKRSIPTPQSLKASAEGAVKSMAEPPSIASMLSGHISRIVGETLKKSVGGAMIALAGEGIAESAQMMLAEVVGGLRVLIGKEGDVSNTSAGSITRFIGGMVLKKAGREVSHSADVSNVTIAKDADMNAQERLEIRGQTIRIEAKKRVRLSKGGLSIEMNPSKINIGGSLKLTSKDRIRIKGAPDNVTRD
jgi:type VI secretion system secreted protein VgrG